MKVLFVTNLWPDDVRPWYGTFVITQARSLEALGVDVSVLSIPGYAGRGEYLRAARRVLRLNTGCRFDVVHGHYGHAALVARLQVRAPLVITYWGSDLRRDRRAPDHLSLKTQAEAEVFRQLARVSAATMTQSEQMHRALPRSTRRRDHVVPAGIDLDRFTPLDRDEARRRLGWSLDEKVVLFGADPDRPRKNYPLAEEVVRRAARSDGEVRLRVAWGLPPEDVPTWLSAADALLFPSHYEGSANVIKEAMAVELPVVATPAGDAEERLDGVPGCYVGPWDAETLTQGLRRALDHGRSPAAREAVAPLGMTAVAERVLGVYESVLAGGSRARA